MAASAKIYQVCMTKYSQIAMNSVQELIATRKSKQMEITSILMSILFLIEVLNSILCCKSNQFD